MNGPCAQEAIGGPDAPDTTPRAGRSLAVLIVGIAVVSLNLRPALVAVGPLTEQLRDDTHLSASGASLLTTLPLICLGLFAALAPVLGRRYGLDRSLLAASGVLIAGICIRAAPPIPALFAGSVIAGIGIAVMNVLLPAVIKRDFTRRIGLVTALYTLMLNGGAALAASVTAPLGQALHINWRTTLALWAIPALIGMVVWIPHAARARHTDDVADKQRVPGLWRNGLAWAVSAFMGFQSMLFYTLIAWLPTILHEDGMSVARAGFWAAMMMVAGIFSSFLVPLVASRQPTQRPLVLGAAALFIIGLLGLMIAPTAGVVAWMIALGVAQGAGISLAMTMFVHRASGSSASAQLSGMAQTVGYLVAAVGPFAAGALRDITGGWTIPLGAMVTLAAGFVISGWLAAANRVVDP